MLGLLTNKVTLYLALVAVAFVGGWKANGWRIQSGQLKDLQAQVRLQQEQAKKDAELARKAIAAQSKAHQETQKLLEKAKHAKFTCKRLSTDFVKLYNESQ